MSDNISAFAANKQKCRGNTQNNKNAKACNRAAAAQQNRRQSGRGRNSQKSKCSSISEENQSSSFSEEYTINSYSDDSSNDSEDENEMEMEEEETGSELECSNSSDNIEEESSNSNAENASDLDKNNDNTAFELKILTNIRKRSSNFETVSNIKKRSNQNNTNNTVQANGIEKKKTKLCQKTATTVKETKIPQSISVTKYKIKQESEPFKQNFLKNDSITNGANKFQELISPLNIDTFFQKYWDKSACMIKRKNSQIYAHLMSMSIIDQMLINNHVEFTKNIDVTLYKNGKRTTAGLVGRALPPAIWSKYAEGCSIRLLNPQTFVTSMHSLMSTLQEFFHCMVGANVYITPPNSQGFAPHFDDIEAFVLQVEGRKRWRLYKPRNQSENLPRVSSRNFKQNEIGDPVFNEVLEPGDVLYFPRGTIHQACTEPGYHSIHITLSVHQKQSYADLFESMVPILLKNTIEKNVSMRRLLPLGTFRNAGLVFKDIKSEERGKFVETVTKLLREFIHSDNLVDYIDESVDQLAKKYQREALPPHLTSSERLHTIFGVSNQTDEDGQCISDFEINLETRLRLLRAHILRLVSDEDKVLRVYYYLDNSKEFCEYEANYLEIDREFSNLIKTFIKSYPKYLSVSDLPSKNSEKKLSLVSALWERGLLMLEKPFK